MKSTGQGNVFRISASLLCGTLLVVVLIRAFRTPPSKATGRYKWVLRSKPRPLVVVAAGIPRTGSTWVFNVLRILLRIRDPNSVSGYFKDLQASLKYMTPEQEVPALDVYMSLNTSLLVKVHGPQPWDRFSGGVSIEKSADISVLTYRDLRTEVRSIMFKRWISTVKLPLKKRKYVFEKTASWVEHAHRMLDIREGTLASIGEGRLIDIAYEEWNGKSRDEQLVVLRRMANQLEWSFTDADLRRGLLEASRIVPPPVDTMIIHPVSQLHGSHFRAPIKHPRINRAIKAGYQAIEKDPRCRHFMKRHGYM